MSTSLLNKTTFKDKEIKRLTEQAEAWEPETKKLLDLIRIKPGWRCADLGCGPRGVLDLLSSLAGPEGCVVGVDIDQEYLDAANEYRIWNNMGNTNLVHANLFNVPLESGSFDLCHARFVFSEVGCDITLLNNMIRITKPGGVIVSQESDLSDWHCHPPQPAWQRLKDVLIDYFKFLGRDINAGLRTPTVFQRSGLTSIRSRNAHITLSYGHRYRPGLIHFFLSLQDDILEAGIMERGELGDTIEQCQAIIENPEIEIHSYAVHQVWAKKKID